jgi:hypothetical protein
MAADLEFAYTKAEIFNKCCLISAYMTKNLKDGGQAAMDDYSMTDDEEDMYEACLESSLPDTWETVLKITSNVNGAYDITDGAPTITIQNNEAYNQNTVDLVDASIKNCIIYGVLRDFYASCYHPDLLKVANDRYNAELAKLEHRLFQLKKKALA